MQLRASSDAHAFELLGSFWQFATSPIATSPPRLPLSGNMKLNEQDTELLKQWVIKRLSDISDADADILADYCLALLTTEEPEDAVKANSIANLQDFLQDQTEGFVNEVFNVIHTRGYDPNAPKPAPAPVAHPQPFQSRKRGFEDEGAPDGRIQAFDGGDRPVKQMRRGGRGGFDSGRGGHFAQAQVQQPWQPTQAMQMPQMLQMPQMPGMPPFDPSDPMSMMAAMQQAMGMSNMAPQPPVQKKAGRRCRDYDTKGFCARGASCIYEHGDDAYIMPGNEPYDPSNAALPGLSDARNANTFDASRGGTRGRGRGRGSGGGFRGGRSRADISAQGPNHDRSNTTIVVEQIPEEKFDEQSVRDFFGEFGEIEEVDMQAYKRLATVKYNDFWSAKAAYESPQVVFDNRFVKVYWYKPENQQDQRMGGAKEVTIKQEEPEIDPVEFAKKQEEAQLRHEQQKKQREEQEKQRSEMDAKLKALEAEKKKMAELMAKKTGKSTTPAAQSPGNATSADDKNKGLREQLAKLEAEAQSLGIDPNSTADNGWTSQYTPRGRGGWRGRGGYQPRGRGWNPGFRGGRGGGAVKRLDNRPKTVSIAFSDGTYDQHNEALAQYLVLSGNLDHAELHKHPDRADAALLAFQERYRAENFMAAASSGIPHVGQVELSWQVNPPVAPPANGTNGHDNDDQAMTDDAKVEVAEPATATMHDAAQAFDVADDDDRW